MTESNKKSCVSELYTYHWEGLDKTNLPHCTTASCPLILNPSSSCFLLSDKSPSPLAAEALVCMF